MPILKRKREEPTEPVKKARLIPNSELMALATLINIIMIDQGQPLLKYCTEGFGAIRYNT